MEKEVWIENVLNSGTGITQSGVNPFTSTRVLAQIERDSTRLTRLTISIAFATALLFALNAFHFQKPSNIQDSTLMVQSAYEIDYSSFYPY